MAASVKSVTTMLSHDTLRAEGLAPFSGSDAPSLYLDQLHYCSHSCLYIAQLRLLQSQLPLAITMQDNFLKIINMNIQI